MRLSTKQKLILAGIIMLLLFIVILATTAYLVYIPASFRGEEFWTYIIATGVPMGPVLVVWLIMCPVVLLLIFRKMRPGERDPYRNFSYADTSEYGTAKSMGEAELRRLETVYVRDIYKADAKGTILGQLGENGHKTIMFNETNKRLNHHMLAFGASRAGKTWGFVLPFLLQVVRRGESVCMSDPKGELFEETSEYFRENGYVVKIINFKDFEFSDGWDLMKELGDPTNISRVQERAFLFANAVVRNSGNEKDMNVSAQISLLNALLLYIYLKSGLEERTTEALCKLLTKTKDELDTEVFSEENIPVSDPAYCSIAAYSSFRSASPNQSGNVKAGLTNTMSSFQIDGVRRMLSDPYGIDLSLLGKRKCAYYFLFPDQNANYRFLTALLFSFVFQDLVDYADARENRRCEVTVNVLLEEAKSVGALPDFATKLSNIASRGINITTIFQTLQQMQAMYPDDWNSVIGNCSTFLGLGFRDLDTAKLFSDFTGTATINVNTERHQTIETAMQFQFAENRGVGTRPVYTMDEMLRINMSECILLLQGCDVLKCKKFPVTLHPDYELMSQKKVKVQDRIPRASDVEGREAYYAQCEADLELYEQRMREGHPPPHGYSSTDYDTHTKEHTPTISQKIVRWVREERVRRNMVVLDSVQKAESDAPIIDTSFVEITDDGYPFEDRGSTADANRSESSNIDDLFDGDSDSDVPFYAKPSFEHRAQPVAGSEFTPVSPTATEPKQTSPTPDNKPKSESTQRNSSVPAQTAEAKPQPAQAGHDNQRKPKQSATEHPKPTNSAAASSPLPNQAAPNPVLFNTTSSKRPRAVKQKRDRREGEMKSAPI